MPGECERADAAQPAQRVEAAHLLDRLRSRERDRGKLHDIQLRQARLLASSEGHLPAALAAAERAVRINPGHREGVSLLTELLERSNQRERVADYLPSIRGAMISKITRAALSLRDLNLLTQIARDHRPELAAVAEAVAFALDPSGDALGRDVDLGARDRYSPASTTSTSSSPGNADRS